VDVDGEGTLKKEVRKRSKRREKMWICSGRREFENRGQEPQGPKKRYMVRLVGPVVKPFGTTVKKEVRKKVERWEKIWTRVCRGYMPPWSLVEEGIAPRWRSVTSRVAHIESGDGGGRGVLARAVFGVGVAVEVTKTRLNNHQEVENRVRWWRRHP